MCVGYSCSTTPLSPDSLTLFFFCYIVACFLTCTEQGTIVEWTAQIGQAVKDGDVVAMVETDKVTVEIKAEMDGVITQQLGAV